MAEERYSDVRVETVAPLRVACYRIVSRSPEEEVSRFLENWIREQKLPSPSRSYGFDVEVTPEQQKDELRGYELWVGVPASAQPAGGVAIRDFAGGLYAVMTIYDPFAKPFEWIPSGWQALWKWVRDNAQYAPASHQMLEQVVVRNGRKDLDIFFPVARRAPT